MQQIRPALLSRELQPRTPLPKNKPEAVGQTDQVSISALYYDPAMDKKARSAYYRGLDLRSPTLFQELTDLLSRTHTKTLGFSPRKYLHPWVDLRPNLRLSSIYNPTVVSSHEPVRVDSPQDLKQKHKVASSVPGRRWDYIKEDYTERAKAWVEAVQGCGMDAVTAAQNIAMLESLKFYNAEHSVPQAHFDRDATPRGDLHHIFTCKTDANQVRQHYKYSELGESGADYQGEGWVLRDRQVFEPEGGKGAVARATLYFLLRYPGKLGDKPGEYTSKDLKTLLKWHQEDPVSHYELHRNHAIEELQGNRNPLIDFPELAKILDFRLGLGDWGRRQV